MIRRFLLLSAFILLSGIIGGAPRSVAAADPASFVGDLGIRALDATSTGYKVTDLIINRISMANAQRDDLISFIQHNGGQVQALLLAMRDKECEQRHHPITDLGFV